jgi:hypothetical protein
METLTKSGQRSVDRLRDTLMNLSRLVDQTTAELRMVESDCDEIEEKTRASITEHLEARASLQMNSAVQAMRSELIAEKTLLGQEIEELRQEKLQWEAERSRLLAEASRASRDLAEVKADQERLLAETDEAAALALDVQIKTAVERARAEFAREAKKSAIDVDAVRAEIARVEGLIQATTNEIDDPQSELSVVIRKNGERAALESYLKGVRFAIPKG